MSAKTARTGREIDEIRKARKGTAWTRRVFRALLSEDELAEYERTIESELRKVKMYTAYDELSGVDVAPEALIRKLDFSHILCLWAYKGLYYALSPLKLPMKRRRGAGEPIRVLRITSWITQGGVAKVCLQTLLRMSGETRNGVLLFQEKIGELPEIQRRPNIELIPRRLNLFPKVLNYKMLKAIFKAAKTARRFRPDIIHLHEPQLAPVARIMSAWAGGATVCVHLHNDYNERQQSISVPLVEVTRHALRRSRLIACSRTILDAGDEWLGGMKHPIALIEDGSDDITPPVSNADRLPERLVEAAGGRRVVAMLSHIVPHKRIIDFLSACRRLLDEGAPIFVCLMAYSAKPKYSSAMRRLFNEMIKPHEGEFLFSVPDAPRMLPHVDIGVTTSVLEGLGLNVLEFQVEGVPVVCTDIKPHREMVEDGASGVLYPPQDVDALVMRIKELLADPGLARRIGEGGREAAARRRWQKTADNMLAFYREILSDKG
ncbi:MAG: glycosyltransferase family 4 protein [Candidatus Sumerlaeia bacterium]